MGLPGAYLGQALHGHHDEGDTAAQVQLGSQRGHLAHRLTGGQTHGITERGIAQARLAAGKGKALQGGLVGRGKIAEKVRGRALTPRRAFFHQHAVHELPQLGLEFAVHTKMGGAGIQGGVAGQLRIDAAEHVVRGPGLEGLHGHGVGHVLIGKQLLAVGRHIVDDPLKGLAQGRGGLEVVLRVEVLQRMVQIAGIARAVVAQQEAAGHLGVGRAQGLRHVRCLGQDVAGNAGLERLALLAHGAELRGQGIGDAVTVLVADGAEESFGSGAVGGLGGEEGADPAGSLDAAFRGGDKTVMGAGYVGQSGQSGNVDAIDLGHGIPPGKWSIGVVRDVRANAVLHEASFMPVPSSLQGKAGSVHFSSSKGDRARQEQATTPPDWQRCCQHGEQDAPPWDKKCHGSPEGLPRQVREDPLSRLFGCSGKERGDQPS